MKLKIKKAKINAINGNFRVGVKITIQECGGLTPVEFLHEQKKLNDYICEALHKFEFHRQDIHIVKG